MAAWKHSPGLVFEHPVTRTRSADITGSRVCRDCGAPVVAQRDEQAAMAEAHAEGWHTPPQGEPREFCPDCPQG